MIQYIVDIGTGQVTGGSMNFKERHECRLGRYPALGYSMVGIRGDMIYHGGSWNSSPVIKILNEDDEVVAELTEEEYSDLQEELEKDKPPINLEETVH